MATVWIVLANGDELIEDRDDRFYDIARRIISFFDPEFQNTTWTYNHILIRTIDGKSVKDFLEL